jgi:hypothetical protein
VRRPPIPIDGDEHGATLDQAGLTTRPGHGSFRAVSVSMYFGQLVLMNPAHQIMSGDNNTPIGRGDATTPAGADLAPLP